MPAPTRWMRFFLVSWIHKLPKNAKPDFYIFNEVLLGGCNHLCYFSSAFPPPQGYAHPKVRGCLQGGRRGWTREEETGLRGRLLGAPPGPEPKENLLVSPSVRAPAIWSFHHWPLLSVETATRAASAQALKPYRERLYWEPLRTQQSWQLRQMFTEKINCQCGASIRHETSHCRRNNSSD